MSELVEVFRCDCWVHVAKEECRKLVHLDLDFNRGFWICRRIGEILAVDAWEGAGLIEADGFEFVVSVVRDTYEIKFGDNA